MRCASAHVGSLMLLDQSHEHFESSTSVWVLSTSSISTAAATAACASVVAMPSVRHQQMCHLGLHGLTTRGTHRCEISTCPPCFQQCLQSAPSAQLFGGWQCSPSTTVARLESGFDTEGRDPRMDPCAAATVRISSLAASGVSHVPSSFLWRRSQGIVPSFLTTLRSYDIISSV